MKWAVARKSPILPFSGIRWHRPADVSITARYPPGRRTDCPECQTKPRNGDIVKIEHTAFNVAEPVLMARWYGEHLGLTVIRRSMDPPHAHFLADDSGTAIIEIYGNREAPLPDYRNMDPIQLHLAFASLDVAADVSRLKAAGASVVAGTHTLNRDTFAMLRDPWGLPLQLVRRDQPMI